MQSAIAVLDDFPLSINLAAFVVAAVVIGLAGTRLAALADALADRTGLGEAVSGALFLGLTTSLPGLVASVVAALEGRPALAIGNAIGGIAAQTTFIGIADMAHKRANLEHAAASAPNMIQAVVLVSLLTLVLLGFSAPDIRIGHMHVVSLLLLVGVGAGSILLYRASKSPMWKPKQTAATVRDVPDENQRNASLPKLLASFGVVATLVGVSGAVVANATGNIADATGMPEGLAGALLSGVATSLPELITTIAAVRRGALTMAVSDIVGGNFVDVLFVAAADFAYLSGSVYHAPGIGRPESFLTALVILMNLVLLLGLLVRQRKGPGNIGLESIVILALYGLGFVVLAFAM